MCLGGVLTAIFVVGCLFWVVAYVVTIRNIRKFRFVEIPVIGGCANLAWEFIWSFPFADQVSGMLGYGSLWGYRIWFILDLYIFYSILRYGHEQVSTTVIRKYFKPITICILLAWTAAFYFYARQGLDIPIGTITAYFDNLPLSALYVVLVLRQSHRYEFSRVVQWSKMLGTGLVSVPVCSYWNTNYFLMTLCAVTLLLYIGYIVAFNFRARTMRVRKGHELSNKEAIERDASRV